MKQVAEPAGFRHMHMMYRDLREDAANAGQYRQTINQGSSLRES